MVEYITKQAAIDLEPPERYERQYQTMNLDDAYEAGWYDAQGEISQLQPADVRPVVRGEWLHEDSASNYLAFKCSVCGTGGRLHKFSFCSHCGADMRGGDADGEEKD